MSCGTNWRKLRSGSETAVARQRWGRGGLNGKMDSIKRFWIGHPVLSNWLILAVGMVIILYFSARHIPFEMTQWAALFGATIALAGLCAWIINWE
jgi:hypothetical protein